LSVSKLGLQVRYGTHVSPVHDVAVLDGCSASDMADIYQGVVRSCMRNGGCTAIQTWGFTDKYSWIGSHSHGTRGAALPFDRAYKPKPAYEAMLKELSSGRKPTP
jgi:GH35 family endo-1,4-beta-xylanase